jgi:molybdate/tungstate transport system substrate-binding protein
MPKPRFSVSKLFHIALLSALLVSCTGSTGSAPGLPATVAPSLAQTESAAAGALPTPPPATRSSAAQLKRTPLVIFCAGSLILPFDQLEKAFEAQNPDAQVLGESHGSIQVIRHVTDIHEKIDVVATADHSLIPMLMYAASDPQTGQPYASWYIRFAGNRLALAYTSRSKFAGQVNDQNWYDVITRPGVRVGLADPRFDASGYRALMALKLAEGYYGKTGLLNHLIKGQFQYPITIFEEDSGAEITVPEILETNTDSGVVVRGASIELLALLESGDLDYAFEYESVIRQHNMQMVTLPDAINLGTAGQAQNYANVVVKLDFRRFVSVKPVFRGEPIGYGITIPSTASQPELARRFIEFLLSPEGRQIMQQNSQPVLDPLQCDGAAHMPLELSALCQAPISQ